MPPDALRDRKPPRDCDTCGLVALTGAAGTAMTLATVLARLPVPKSDLEGRISHGLPPGAATLADLAAGGAALARLVAAVRAQAKGGDDKLGCAYLIGGLSWEIGNLLSHLWLSGWHVHEVDPALVAVTLRPVVWGEAGDGGTAQVIDLHLGAGAMTCGPDLPVHLAAAMIALHRDIIAALVTETGLGAAAQWRLVGDGISGAILQQGKALGRVAQAVALARQVVGDQGSKLYSRQTEVVGIILPDDAPGTPARDWFRLRGGCCRFYTSEGGEYCSTCVLRDRDDQIARLQDHLSATLKPHHERG